MEEKLLPVCPLRDTPLFPKTETVLYFGRPRSVAAVKAAFDSEKLVFVVLQKDSNKTEPANGELFNVGTVCQIKHVLYAENGEVSVLVNALYRAKVENYQNFDGFTLASVQSFDASEKPTEEEMVLGNHIVNLLQSALRAGKPFDFLVMMRVMAGITPQELIDLTAPMLDEKPDEKQIILEEPNLKPRLEKIIDSLNREIKNLEVEKNLAARMQTQMDKNYKERILQEKKRAIEEELGEEDEEKSEAKELMDKLVKAKMPAEVHKKAEKELKKFEKMSNMNPEKGWLRNYLDWLLDMPWGKVSPNNADIKNAEAILNEDHFGLEKVKERIIEHLAVLKLQHEESKDDQSDPSPEESSGKTTLPGEGLAKKKKTAMPTILCFVGPPGVGKTSLGKSIAKALNREFVRVSLGGIRDEAEIRGHRRTYVGALPGRIIQGIKQAG